MSEIKRIVLGRTGLQVSALGLGCGGYAKLGLNEGSDDEHAERIIRRALDRGINTIDTADGYGTEEHIGRMIRSVRREKLVVCSKSAPRDERGLRDAGDLRRAVETSLRRMQTDYIDVYAIHGLLPDDYDAAVDRLVPEFVRLKERGLIRAFGVTESFERDTGHAMLIRAVRDEFWDTMMVGFNIINQSARLSLFEEAAAKGRGIICMFAVRHALVNNDNLRPVLKRLISSGELNADELDIDKPLDFALAETRSGSLAEVAYRFALQEEHIHTVLSGTGSLEHLDANIDAVLAGPLSDETFERLKRIFERVRSECGKRPDGPR